jgi:uncharacterized protein (DUF58 family)
LSRLRLLSRLRVLSGLTVRGRCLVAAGLAAGLCALALNERDLLRVAVFVTAMPLLALVVSGRAHHGLTATRRIVPDRVTVGTETTVRLQVGRRGRLAVASFELADGVPRGMGGPPRFLLSMVTKTASTVLEYPVRPQLRGVHHIGPARLSVSDPLGLSEFERELAGHTRLIARPKVVPLSGFPSGSGLGAGEDGAVRSRTGHGEDDSTVRQYRQGDDMRRVHWKTTARRDELMVRVEEHPWWGGVTILLDRRSAAHRGRGARSSLEWAVSAVASVGTHLHRHGQMVRVVTEDGQVLSDGGGLHVDDHDNEVLLDALAVVQPSTQRDLVWGADPAGGRELIAVLGETTPPAVAELTLLRPQGTLNLAVLLDVRAWGREYGDGGVALAETEQQLRASGWTVVIADGPDASMSTLWQHLCHGSSAPLASEETS